MPKISELWGLTKVLGHDGRMPETCLIIGSGPSVGLCNLRAMWQEFDYTIVLNQAWRLLSTFDMLLTIHPHEVEVIPDGPEVFCKEHVCVIATKRKGKTGWASELTPEAYGNVYVFTNNEDVHDFTNVSKASDEVYAGRGIQATAMSIAAHMGFKQLYLVGCDMTSLDGHHHAQVHHHVRMHGLEEEEIYREYYECSFRVREIIRKEFRVQAYTITPFLGIGREQEDYKRQLTERDMRTALVSNNQEDTSAYTREKDTFL